jgi:hypothetical protein
MNCWATQLSHMGELERSASDAYGTAPASVRSVGHAVSG